MVVIVLSVRLNEHFGEWTICILDRRIGFGDC